MYTSDLKFQFFKDFHDQRQFFHISKKSFNRVLSNIKKNPQKLLYLKTKMFKTRTK